MYLQSAYPGGEFSILEARARLSVPKLSHYSVGDKNYGNDFGKAWSEAEETHGTLTRNWLVSDNWAFDWSLISRQQEKKPVNIVSLSTETNTTVKKIIDIVRYAVDHKECADAFKAIGIPSIWEQLDNLTIVTQGVFSSSQNDHHWTWNSDIGQKMRELFEKKPTTNDLSWIGEYEDTGRRFMGIADRAVAEKDDNFDAVVIHSFIHTGGKEGIPYTYFSRPVIDWFTKTEYPPDLHYLGQKYDDIMKACTKKGSRRPDAAPYGR